MDFRFTGVGTRPNAVPFTSKHHASPDALLLVHTHHTNDIIKVRQLGGVERIL